MGWMLDQGAEIAGYRVLKELGRGGMGLVYEAEHLRLGRKAALKLLTPDLAADENVRERFVQESRLIAAIDHPNIIPIYDAGDVEGTLYIAMRLVGGGDLAKAIKREGALPVDRTLGLVEQAAAALDAAHARGMVHRDVKPANVLLDDAQSGRVYLSDFGVAKLTGSDRATKAGMFIGSVDYAAPEQIEGGEIAPATDVYALGCVLFECLTGKRPYAKPTNVAVLFGHLREAVPLATDVRTDLPESVNDVIAKALAKEPSERYESCGELAAAAREALAGERVETTYPSRQRLRTIGEPAARAAVAAPPTPLLGRDAELEAVAELLADPEVRLVTLTGPGGTGKTRLALEAMARADLRGGVFYVELETLTEAGLVLVAIAEAVGSAEADTESLARHLADEPALLVLDNFEHVLPAAPLVGRLLSAAPATKALITSRAPLRLRAERELPVPPLAPSPAAELFVQRAREAKPDFELDGESTEAVAEICARLDGLPLAIELAAARVRLLSPAAMLSRLDRQLALLTSGSPELPSRHQTMRGAVEWSYDLLDEPARVLLARLAVFAGGWTMAAAEAVCASTDLDEDAILDSMTALVDGSLARPAAGSEGEPRFELLQIVQEFGTYQLIERGELEEVRRRHAEHFLVQAEQAEPELTGPDQAAWLARLANDTGNLRAALRWSEESGEVELGLRIAGALPRFWSVQGLMAEIRPWLARALAGEAEAAPPVRAKALFAAGHAALGQGQYAEATAHFEEALALNRELGDERGQAACLAQLGWVSFARGDADAASATSTRGLAIAEELGAWGIASVARSTLGELAAQRGAFPQAAELLEQSLALRRRLGDRRNIANALLSLARIEFLRSDAERAAELANEGLEIAREVDDTWSIALGSGTLGLLALEAGELEDARSQLVTALELSWRRGDDRNVAEPLFALAAVAARSGDVHAAARIWGAADALREATGASPSATERRLEERYLAAVRHALGSTALEAERAAGAARTVEEAVDLALGA